MEKAGEEKGVCGGVWECGKPERFSIISMPQSEGEAFFAKSSTASGVR